MGEEGREKQDVLLSDAPGLQASCRDGCKHREARPHWTSDVLPGTSLSSGQQLCTKIAQPFESNQVITQGRKRKKAVLTFYCYDDGDDD